MPSGDGPRRTPRTIARLVVAASVRRHDLDADLARRRRAVLADTHPRHAESFAP
jgi:hypothetical protein